MNVQTPRAVAEHKNLVAALAAAQMQMGKATKSATNPHFKTKYADLAEVMDACMAALNANGIAVLQPLAERDGQRVVLTILAHESGEREECAVPLIVQKNDMQGLGGAITYARRYGLMCMAGIAPEDDDGNAAAAAAPRQEPAPARAAARGPDPLAQTRAAIAAAQSTAALTDLWRTLPPDVRDPLTAEFAARKVAIAQAATMPPLEDEIPY